MDGNWTWDSFLYMSARRVKKRKQKTNDFYGIKKQFFCLLPQKKMDFFISEKKIRNKKQKQKTQNKFKKKRGKKVNSWLKHDQHTNFVKKN